MSSVLEVLGLTKTYKSLSGDETVALAGLNLVVEKGEVHGFLGPNGSGKTTTLRILLGLARADAGRMRIFGHEVPAQLPDVVNRVGAIVESPQFFTPFTGRRTLSLLAGTTGVPQERVNQVLEQVGLRDRADQRVKSYSLGMRQRLAVAAALLKSPELLILDEPTNGMDPAGIREMRELIRRLAADGATVLVSSHLLSEVEQLCDTMTIVSRGRTVTAGRVDEVIAAHTARRFRVRVPEQDALPVAAAHLSNRGLTVEPGPDHLLVSGSVNAESITKTLADESIYLSELTSLVPDLETVFLELTGTGPVDGHYPQVDESVLPPPAPHPMTGRPPQEAALTVAPIHPGEETPR